jgi:hypothetical protein
MYMGPPGNVTKLHWTAIPQLNPLYGRYLVVGCTHLHRG